MAFTEAAGWLAHAHAWVHPLDLTGSTALAATGGGHRVLPHTFATWQSVCLRAYLGQPDLRARRRQLIRHQRRPTTNPRHT
jgi:hypothetical protein